ncbi:flagellar export chaperone FliS [Pelosinus sp. sgz500959]|uniref:flagellar export chaperone FliS n=1 Tax=Pelosinus sp. sgz500959 TaxID=3242472 RepID=UPI00366D3034
MVYTNMANTYKNQQIMTSSPEELTLLLYNGAIRFITESVAAMEQGNMQQAHNSNLRAQDIVREFMATLDTSYEISKTWMPLYDYVIYCLIQGNIKKDKEQLLQAKTILFELREAWVAAMKQTRMGRVAGK